MSHSKTSPWALLRSSTNFSFPKTTARRRNYSHQIRKEKYVLTSINTKTNKVQRTVQNWIPNSAKAEGKDLLDIQDHWIAHHWNYNLIRSQTLKDKAEIKIALILTTKEASRTFKRRWGTSIKRLDLSSKDTRPGASITTIKSSGLSESNTEI